MAIIKIVMNAAILRCMAEQVLSSTGLEVSFSYGAKLISNDLIVAVDFDKTILAFIPLKVAGNMILLTWKIAGAPSAVLFVPIRIT
jgi:hypothetical protein